MQEKNQLCGGGTRLAGQTEKGGERQMSYLLQVANQRPMLRISAEVVFVFCCAAPLVLALTSFVDYGLRSLTH